MTIRGLEGQNSPWGEIRGEGVRHAVYQWDAVYDNDDFMKGGWAGQGLMINPRKDLVAVWTGYLNDEGRFNSVLPMIREIWNDLYPDEGTSDEVASMAMETVTATSRR